MASFFSQPVSLFQFKWFKPSHRGWAEQSMGLGIFLLLAFVLLLLVRWLAFFSIDSEWFRLLRQAPWAPSHWAVSSVWSPFYIVQAAGIWLLWRRYSLRTLKFEASLFLSQFALLILWSISFFIWRQELLALVFLLLLFVSTLMSTVVFWKKERLAGQLMLAPLAWICFVSSLNMAICMMNP